MRDKEEIVNYIEELRLKYKNILDKDTKKKIEIQLKTLLWVIGKHEKTGLII